MQVGLIFAFLIGVTAAALAQTPSTRPATAPQAGATTKSTTAPADTPKQALRALNVALRDGDAPSIRNLFLTHNENGAKLIGAMADYAGALRLTDEALKVLPNDATLHEFRALVLFAVEKYELASGPLLYPYTSAQPAK